MRDKWPHKKLGDLATISRGSSPRPIADSRYFDGGTIPWIKIADATKSGKFLYETKEHVNEYGASFSRRLPSGTILVAASGTLGYTQILGVEGCAHDGWLILQELGDLDRDFAYYALKTLERHFFNSAYGAAIQNINTEILRNTEIPYPPPPVQRRVASILSAYDDLIENDQRRIRILEEMTRRLYREWFITLRFPSYDKTSRAALRPGKIPQTWEVRKLGEIAEEMRRNVPKGELDERKPYVGLEHIPRRSLALDAWEMAMDLGSNKLEFKKGEVLFGKIRPYFHKVSVAPFDGLCSADTIVIRARSPKHYAFVVACVSSDAFVAHASATANGAKMPRANWNVLQKYEVVIPNGKVAEQFSALFADVIAKQQALIFQIQNLRRTRDLLLPRLLSGQIDLSAIEKEEQVVA
jgi:type I restriction enzyme S subunit